MINTPSSRRARQKRWVLPRLNEPVPQARVTALDRCPPLLLLGGMLLVSGLAHAIAVNTMGRSRPPENAARAAPVEVAVIEKPPDPAPPLPTPVAPAPPVPVAPRRRTLAPAAPAAARAQSPLPPPEAPAPSPEPPAPEPVPILMPGVPLSATSVAGSMAVRGGDSGSGSGTGTGTGTGRPTGGGTTRPYRAQEFAEAYALTDEPLFLHNVSDEQQRRFYPERARKEKFTGDVVVQLLIDDDGSVARVKVPVDPGYGLGAAAAKIARLYRFKPGKVNGRPVATEIRFTIHFELVD